jgi:hypothetical protein
VNGWTEERRRRHSAAIRRWKPWEHSTGPRTAEGKARSSRNAYKGSKRWALRELARLLAQLRDNERLAADTLFGAKSGWNLDSMTGMAVVSSS